MIYSILLRDENDWAYWHHDSILPGIVPEHVFDLMVARVVDEQLGLCKLCDVHGARCHVIDDSAGGRKLCPVLFVDAVHPGWTVDQVA